MYKQYAACHLLGRGHLCIFQYKIIQKTQVKVNSLVPKGIFMGHVIWDHHKFENKYHLRKYID